MKDYLRVEFDGEAANCADLITDLLEREYPVSLDEDGFLLVSKNRWQELEELARKHKCELYNRELTRQAA
ncbi:MAG TPA: hypothetical protein VEF04_00790 [Blastocatellia bacterium]|nr:hypothetical protein [Blastocatellia bacterium]